MVGAAKFGQNPREKITAVSFILLFQYLKIKLRIIPKIPLRKNPPVVLPVNGNSGWLPV
jgi:hypothetical protein